MNSKVIIGLILVAVIIAGILVYTDTNTKKTIPPSEDPLLGQEPVIPPSEDPVLEQEPTPPSSEAFVDQELPLETISKGYYSGHEEEKNYILKDNTEWTNLWSIVHSNRSPEPELPSINFNSEIVIAVFQGTRSTGGYSIEVTKIIEKESTVAVFIKKTEPSPGGVTTQALTSPYHIIKTKKVDKEIIFTE